MVDISKLFDTRDITKIYPLYYNEIDRDGTMLAIFRLIIAVNILYFLFSNRSHLFGLLVTSAIIMGIVYMVFTESPCETDISGCAMYSANSATSPGAVPDVGQGLFERMQKLASRDMPERLASYSSAPKSAVFNTAYDETAIRRMFNPDPNRRIR